MEINVKKGNKNASPEIFNIHTVNWPFKASRRETV